MKIILSIVMEKICQKYIKTETTINTPAGNFEDCTTFEGETSLDYQILNPGVGFVKFAYDDYTGGYKEYTLIAY